MKPIIIYPGESGNKITMTRKEFEDYINKAYQSGYDQGYAEGKKTYWSYPWYNTTTTVGNNLQSTGNNPIRYDTITCKSMENLTNTIMGEVHNAIGD